MLIVVIRRAENGDCLASVAHREPR